MGPTLHPSHTTIGSINSPALPPCVRVSRARREALLKELTVAGSVERSLLNMWASNIRRLLIGSKSGSGDEDQGWELPIRAYQSVPKVQIASKADRCQHCGKLETLDGPPLQAHHHDGYTDPLMGLQGKMPWFLESAETD
jgi:hypothetical protein